MSTIHKARMHTFVKRRTKDVNGKYKPLYVKQPTVFVDYNKHMCGVDKSDQLINKYNVLRKTKKYWKMLFLHSIDIVRVNSFVIFCKWQQENTDIVDLQRKQSYSHLDFIEELIRDLGGIVENEHVPTCNKPLTYGKHAMLPEWTQFRRQCAMCKMESYIRCTVCEQFLCFNKKRNCLSQYHKA